MIRRCVVLVLLHAPAHARIESQPGAAGSLGPSRTGVFAREDRLGEQLEHSCRQFLQKGFAGLGQFFFEPFCTIAIAAGPELGPVFVTTIAT